MPAPATGFAFDVDNVAWALRAQGNSLLDESPMRLVVAGDAALADALATELRSLGVPASRVEGAQKPALEYAASWDYPLVVIAGARSHRVVRVRDGATLRVAVGAPDLIHLLTSFAHVASGAAL